MDAETALLIKEDLATALVHAEAAQTQGRETGDEDVAIMALAIQGLALVGSGEVAAGMARLDETAASALGGELQAAPWANRILCYVIYACEWVRDVDRAAQWCAPLRELADQTRLHFAQGICRVHYASVLISRGEWTEAEQHLAEATAMLNESPPPYAVEAVVRLGDLRRRQGQLDEATSIFREVEWHPRALLGSAEVALDGAQPDDARELVGRFLRQMPESNRIQRAAAFELLVRIEGLLGDHDRAAAVAHAVHHGLIQRHPRVTFGAPMAGIGHAHLPIRNGLFTGSHALATH